MLDSEGRMVADAHIDILYDVNNIYEFYETLIGYVYCEASQTGTQQQESST